MDWTEAIESNARRWHKREGGVEGRRAELQKVVEKHAVVELIDDCGTYDLIGLDTVEEAIEVLHQFVHCDPVGVGRISVAGCRVEPVVTFQLLPASS